MRIPREGMSLSQRTKSPSLGTAEGCSPPRSRSLGVPTTLGSPRARGARSLLPTPTHRARLDLEVPLDATGQEEELALGAASSLCVGGTHWGAGGPFTQQDPKGHPESPSYPAGTILWGSSCILPILPG